MAMVAHVWATDEVHAIKIANEHRAQLIANNEWLPDDQRKDEAQ